MAEEGEVLEVLDHVAVVLVEPELVEFVRRGLLFIQPDRAPGRLPKLGPVGLKHQWDRQPVGLGVRAFSPVNQVDAGRDVPPLVRAPDFQLHVVVAVEV